jgi:hypothetical protein
MKRRETYATTGPRMTVRFFGGFDFEAADASNRMPAKIGYTKGVPMGGDLSDAPTGIALTFLVAALKDPIGANLDRYQIIKGWMDAKGALHEKVYDVAWSGNRQAGADGKLPSVGSTVDVPNATWSNTIGATDSSRCGKTRISTRASAPSTTAASLRFHSALDCLRREISASPCRRKSHDDH